MIKEKLQAFEYSFPEGIEVKSDGKTIWVNTSKQCRLRIQGFDQIEVESNLGKGADKLVELGQFEIVDIKIGGELYGRK